jgi:catechol 2,3-dioxygenase-like lactoylglutathione lyase family enzyme
MSETNTKSGSDLSTADAVQTILKDAGFTMEEVDLTGDDESSPVGGSADQTGCRNTGVHHVGLYAKDPSASAEFYRDLLGMQIVGGSGPEHPLGASAFLCSRLDEESHEIALFANPALAHVAFKVASLVELRAFQARVVERGIPIKFTFNHGISFAFYFDDPDGHMIEVYWPTGAPQSHRQPYVEPLDLTQPDDSLLEKVIPGPVGPPVS